MDVFPASAEEKLGFGVLRERLDGLMRSRLGQERLQGMRLAGSVDWLRGELARVSELQEAFRFDDPVPLDHVLDVREVLRRAAPEGGLVNPDELVALRLVLGTLRRLRGYFQTRSSKYPQLDRSVQRIRPLPHLEDRISEIVDDDGRVRDDASQELLRLRRLIVRRQAQLRETLQAELRRAIGQGYATEEQPTIRSGRMVIPVRAEAKRKIQGFVHDTSTTGQTVYIEPTAVLDLNNEVRELESEEQREVERILRAVTGSIRQHLDDLRTGVRALAQFDLLQAKARLANEIDAVVPDIASDGIIEVRGGRNPLLILHFKRLREEEKADRDVVPLELQLGRAYRTLVITGPNAGGKTVAMKTIGLFALMLGYGMPIPVDLGSRFPLFDQLMADIGDEQSIEEDLSTFSSHVSNLKRMTADAGEGSLVLIDEAGTGTDPAEGGALAQAVLERLTAAGACTIVTTHHGTLKVFAHETEGVENGSMAFDQATLSPTYRFQAGVPGSSYAFEIAQRIGLQGALLERARDLVGRQKTALEELITTFETRNQELERRLMEAEKSLGQAEHERRTYAGRAEKLKKEREEIRRQALEEAQRIVEQANARVERTIREIKEAQAEKEATRGAREELDRFKQQVARRRAKSERRERRRSDAEQSEPSKDSGRQQASAATGPIHVGDQVVLDGGSTVAEVVELEGDEAVIAFGSMRIRAGLERLRKVGGKRAQRVTVRQVESTSSSLPAVKARNKIDLRGERVEDALNEVTHFLDDALSAGLGTLEILHGKGTGALRSAIHEYLATRPDVAAYDEAPIEQGGAGVTLVTLK